MLYIYIDKSRSMLQNDWITDISASFDIEYEASWFADELVQRIIKIVDKSEVQTFQVGDSVNIYNKIYGNLSPRDLSNGSKSLILLWKTDYKINGDRMGNNCISLLLEIASKKDITISLGHIPAFPSVFEATIINNNMLIHSKREFIDCQVALMYE